MIRAYINVALGEILRRSDPLGRIYGWIPSGDLLGSVAQVPYLEELYTLFTNGCQPGTSAQPNMESRRFGIKNCFPANFYQLTGQQ